MELNPNIIRRSAMRLLLVGCLVAVISACGFGDYREQTYFEPQVTDGWVLTNRMAYGKFFGHDCNQGKVLLDHIVVEPKKVAQAVLYLPLPAKDDRTGPNIKQPIRFEVVFHGLDLLSCDRLLTVTSSETQQALIPSVLREGHQPTRHYCTYKLPPSEDLGGQFRLEFDSATLKCNITPLQFIRKGKRIYDGIRIGA